MVIDDLEADGLSLIIPAHVEVTKPARVAQNDVSAVVDDVELDAVMRLVDQRARGHLVVCLVGDSRGLSTTGPVRTHVVVLGDFLVEGAPSTRQHSNSRTNRFS